MSKLSDFLLEFGPALATNPSSGSIFTDLNRAAKKPAQSLIGYYNYCLLAFYSVLNG